MQSFSVCYGTMDKQIDITKIAIEKCTHQNTLFIPMGDTTRVTLFGDPATGYSKYIFIRNNITKYISIIDEAQETVIVLGIESVLHNIHQQLTIDYGTFYDEYPEQLMTVKYIKGHEKVLELRGNIGRNSLIIGYILNKCNNNKFVTLESDSDIFEKLKHNREINKLDFFVENMALSKRNLIQTGWNTFVSDELMDGYKKVNTITLHELRDKYQIDFDTLVLDCEGAFYYILVDMPEILNTVNLIIMVNDYICIEHKEYVDQVLKKNGFYVDYSRDAGLGQEPYVKCCFNNFFEVWVRY
jgi:FkbM family methyltransferase